MNNQQEDVRHHIKLHDEDNEKLCADIRAGVVVSIPGTGMWASPFAVCDDCGKMLQEHCSFLGRGQERAFR